MMISEQLTSVSTESMVNRTIEKFPELCEVKHKLMLKFVVAQSDSVQEMLKVLDPANTNDGTRENKLVEIALSTLVKGNYGNELALLVVLSRLLCPLSYEEIQFVWSELQLTDSYNATPEDAFLFLANNGFLTAEKINNISLFSVSDFVRENLQLSAEDSRNAHIALANFYTKKKCDANFHEGVKAKSIQEHLTAAGLELQSVQMILSLLPPILEKKMYQDAYDLLKKALHASGSELRLCVMIRLQYASVCLMLNRMLESTEAMEKAISELDELKNIIGAMATRNQLAAIYAANGQMKKARLKFIEVFEAQEKLKNVSGIAAAASQLGTFLHHTKSDIEAVKYLYISYLLSGLLSDEEGNLHRRNFEAVKEELGEGHFNEIMRSVGIEAESIAQKYQA